MTAPLETLLSDLTKARERASASVARIADARSVLTGARVVYGANDATPERFANVLDAEHGLRMWETHAAAATLDIERRSDAVRAERNRLAALVFPIVTGRQGGKYELPPNSRLAIAESGELCNYTSREEWLEVAKKQGDGWGVQLQNEHGAAGLLVRVSYRSQESCDAHRLKSVVPVGGWYFHRLNGPDGLDYRQEYVQHGLFAYTYQHPVSLGIHKRVASWVQGALMQRGALSAEVLPMAEGLPPDNRDPARRAGATRRRAGLKHAAITHHVKRCIRGAAQPRLRGELRP